MLFCLLASDVVVVVVVVGLVVVVIDAVVVVVVVIIVVVVVIIVIVVVVVGSSLSVSVSIPTSPYLSFRHRRRRLSRQGLMATGWRGLPVYGVTGAMQYTNGRTYFFSRNGVYYRWNDDDDVVDVANPRFPRNTGEWWFDCK